MSVVETQLCELGLGDGDGGKGEGDRLAFRGSGAPKWVFLDEVYLFLDEVDV